VGSALRRAMSTVTSSPLSRSDARSSFIRSRVASFLAVVPLGAWVVVHLWHNLYAFEGPEAWQSAVTGYAHPFAEAVVGVIVLLPLAIHTVWGIGRLFTTRPNNLRYGYYGNLKYLLQRLTAIGVVLFLGAHLWLAFIKPRIVDGHAEAFADISHEMHFHTPTLVVYLLGTLGVSYHLANGLQTFAMGWGLVSTQKGLRRLETWVILGFVLLLAMSWGAIYALWASGAYAPS
jgi:succinate dehydrogenase / fumarate reductase cytochrome b subunit